MNIPALLADIKNGAKTGINEAEAKALLKEFGVPVVPETVVANYNEAISVAVLISPRRTAFSRMIRAWCLTLAAVGTMSMMEAR